MSISCSEIEGELRRAFPVADRLTLSLRLKAVVMYGDSLRKLGTPSVIVENLKSMLPQGVTLTEAPDLCGQNLFFARFNKVDEYYLIVHSEDYPELQPGSSFEPLYIF